MQRLAGHWLHDIIPSHNMPGHGHMTATRRRIIAGTLAVSPKVPARTLPEFIAYARAHPGRISAATQGPATTSHLTSEWFQQVADVKFVTVPYRGSAPALQGMVAGDVDIIFDNLGVSL